jgi:hypothetical protein
MSTISSGTTSTTTLIHSGDTTGSLVFKTNDTGSGGTTAMTIDTSQNVGIGTSSPSYKLDVRSSLAVLDGSSNIGFYANGTSYTQVWQTFQSPNDLLIKTTAAKYIAFLPNSTEAMRIDSSGILLLNTTSSYSNERLRIKNGNDTRAIGFQSASSNECGYIYINSGGTSTTYSTSSDYRLKENITPMTGALQKVAQLKPCTYTWKVNGFEGQGFIAHELQEVVPDCVTGEKDAVDADGNPVYQGVDTSFLVATLTAALQEAHGLIKDLQSRVIALEAK